MTTREITNEAFLNGYLSTAKENHVRVVLPHEKVFVDRAVEAQRNAYAEVVDEKVKVSGGDDWHDGAFRATDNQAKIIGQRMSAIVPFIDAPVVGYPGEGELRVTLGSRVIIEQKGYEFPVDVVGFREGHPEGLEVVGQEDPVMAISPDSPLARAIIGHTEGVEIGYNSNGNEMSVRLLRIDQLGIRDFFMNQVEIVPGKD